MGRRAALALLALSLSLASPSLPGSARAAPEASRIRFESEPGASVLVHGTYPKVESSCERVTQPVLHARYAGTIEVGRDADGSLFLIGEMSFQDYLNGLAEVPRTWPMAALKAQVVAARSYALSRMDRPDAEGARLGYDLCATDACQVYRGTAIVEGPYGDRWDRAVRSTEGEVLLHRGKPADTVYSSTSPGYTLGNEEVFGSDPVPYLRPIEERDDGASPVSEWTVNMPLADLARFLRAAGHWGDRPVASVRRKKDDVVVKGGGKTERMDVAHFRNHLNHHAWCLAPDRYPGLDGGSRLPQTIPSVWFDLRTADGAMVLEGRGWGHGVGMVQWGAYGKARRGLNYEQILGAYYGGLTPRTVAMPDRIRIGLATGLRTVTVAPSGSVRVAGPGGGEGPWRVTGGKRLRVRPGHEPPASVDPARLTQAPTARRAGRDLTAVVSVPELSVAQLVLRVGGADVPIGPRVTFPAGRHELGGTVPAVPDGRYELRALTTDGVDRVLSAARALRVTGSPVPVPSPSPSPSPSAARAAPEAIGAPPSPRPGPGGLAPVAVAVPAGSALVLGLAGLLLRRRRRGRRTSAGGGGPR